MDGVSDSSCMDLKQSHPSAPPVEAAPASGGSGMGLGAACGCGFAVRGGSPGWCEACGYFPSSSTEAYLIVSMEAR